MLDVEGQLIGVGELITRIGSLIREGGTYVSRAEPDGSLVESSARRGALERFTSTRRGKNAQGTSGKGLATRLLGRLQHSSASDNDTLSAVEDLEGKVRWLVSEVHSLQGGLDMSRRQNVAMRMELTRVREAIARCQADDHADRSDLRSLQKEVSTILERLGAASSSGADINYAGFEDRFRGSSEEVKASQQNYLRFFPAPSAAGAILDVGCGRGEMLEVLMEAGHRVIGVDMDSTMVKVCESKGLPVVQDDVLHYLAGIAPGSLKGIFCAQVVEHLLTSELERFLGLAYDRLRPSGVLLVETINPRSLHALSNHFFADTSHVRPVHSETLRFLCEQIGFNQVDLEERSEHPLAELANQLSGGDLETAIGALLRTVYGFQDYVIAATK